MMPRRIFAAAGSLASMLVGGWLILAPYALGYRGTGSAWNRPSEVDVWTGAGVMAVGLIAPLVRALLIDLDERDKQTVASENHVAPTPQPTRRSYS